MNSQFLFSPNTNIATGLGATNFLTASQYETLSRVATGGGTVGLSGSYTGAQDATFEVEVLNDTITSAPGISSPVFVGTGNGTIGSLSATAGVDAQDWTVTLKDLGTPTTYARYQYRGVTLVAADSGDAGNLITLSIDHSALVYTATSYSLPVAVTAGNEDFIGSEWNFGAVEINSDGTVPATAPRLKIGNDPTEYRHYKEFDGEAYHYRFDPPLREDAAAGAPVYLVSGTRTVTITNGTTTETHSSIQTIFDMLSAIQTSSTLLTVDGVVSNDKAPGGNGLLALNDRTNAYIRRIDFDGTDYLNEIQGAAVATAAPTERISIECIGGPAGAEEWKVRGDVTGTMNRARTGVPYQSSQSLTGPGGVTEPVVSFTIPVREPETVAPVGATVTVSEDWQFRPEDEVPVLCQDKVQALPGAAARNMTVTFTYRARPVNDCDCDTITLTGFPREDCLGIEPPEDFVGTLTAPLQKRVEDVTSAMQARTKANTSGFAKLADSKLLTPIEATGQQTDLLLIETCYHIAGKAVVALASGDLEPDAWVASTAYAEDDVIEPTTANGFRYRAQGAGTSDSTEPVSWTTTVGGTTTDNDITWENIGKKPLGLWDDEFAAMDTLLAAMLDNKYERAANDQDTFVHSGTAVEATEWTASEVINVLADGKPNYRYPATRNGHVYSTKNSGTTGGSEPTWPTDGTSVTDGGVVWWDLGAYWVASTAYSLDDLIAVPMGAYNAGVPGGIGMMVLKCVTAGTSGGSEPGWDNDPVIGTQFTDGGVTWEVVSFEDPALGTSPTDIEDADRFAERYRAAFTHVLNVAGITPNFLDAGIAGTLCWQDPGHTHWWVPNSGSGLLPAFTNVAYHSVTRDPDGNIVPTFEFFFYPAIACDDKLQEGDQLIVTIDGVGNVYQTYLPGDRIDLHVVHADPLALTGGQTGDDTISFSVVGSVDGSLPDYDIDLDSPGSYSESGLSFTITPGTIAFALGDRFTFSTEGGQFRWRKDGGSWSGATDIDDTVVLSDGVSASFTSGAAPSFLTGDTYQIKAVAASGPQRAETPDSQWMEWTGSGTTITIPGGSAVSGVLLSHDIDAGAEIRFQGSDDGFSSTPLDEVVPNNPNVTALTWTSVTYAAYRIVIDSGAGRIRWICAGVPFVPRLVGVWQPEDQTNFNGVFAGTAEGGTWTLDKITNTEFATLKTAVRDAFASHQGRVGFHIAAGDAYFCEVTSTTLVPVDYHRHQATDPTNRILSVALTMQGLP